MVVNVGEIAEQAIRPADLGAQEASIARVSSELVESCLQPPLAGLRDRPEHAFSRRLPGCEIGRSTACGASQHVA
jgi:hypothetical protein